MAIPLSIILTRFATIGVPAAGAVDLSHFRAIVTSDLDFSLFYTHNVPYCSTAH
jgi:hypothetical protein